MVLAKIEMSLYPYLQNLVGKQHNKNHCGGKPSGIAAQRRGMISPGEACDIIVHVVNGHMSISLSRHVSV